MPDRSIEVLRSGAIAVLFIPKIEDHLHFHS